MPVLLRSQKVSRAADLKVAHGNLNPGAKICKFPDRRKPFFRYLF